MANLSWLSTADRLRPADLTVRAQALPPNDMGDLLWDAFFPRENVPSTKLTDLTVLDYRPTADRREWNARGRRVPIINPTTRTVEIVPVEANSRIDEKEMQRLTEQAQGNEQILRDQIMASVPKRVDMLAMACYRRLEVDAFKAWTTGTIVQRNPENAAQTVTMTFGFSSARLLTAGTAWDNGGVNAYDLLLASAVAAEDLVGPIEGFMTRLNVFNAILADAPDLPNAVNMTRSGLEDRISEDLGRPFQFFINENSVDIFDDGGTAYTRTKVFPAGYAVAVPQGQTVGRSAFAPVVRAYELAREAGPQAGIDVNGVTIYYEADNGGRGLSIESQLNAIPVPEEQKLYSVNTLIA